jgi:hypothetical protein
MTDLPESVSLEWLGRQFLAQRDDLRALRTDMDMLIRLVTRIDTTLDAVREGIRSLWGTSGDLRRRSACGGAAMIQVLTIAKAPGEGYSEG